MATATGVHILNLSTLLESKCAAIINRSVEPKRTTDAYDIIFILNLATKEGITFSSDQVIRNKEAGHARHPQ